MQEKVLIVDFGSQYTQLIARRVREHAVYSEIVPFDKIPDLSNYKGIILSGSPCSVRQENPPLIDLDAIIGKLPVLAVCYGAQMIAHQMGGSVEQSDKREYGRARIQIKDDASILSGVEPGSDVWMSHSDSIVNLPDAFDCIASTEDIPFAAFASKADAYNHPVYALQFHPEVTHSTHGSQILKNFLYDVCNLSGDWTPEAFVEQTVSDLKQQLGDDHVVLGLSGGVDSSVAAMLLHKAIGERLVCLFVDNGLLRKNEFEDVLEQYKSWGLNVKGIQAGDQFLSELAGVSDPEKKRKIIGRVFIEVFEAEANKLQDVSWLAQGTIYPDVIESVSVHGPSVTIKSHHNVGGLPDKLNLKIVEPLRNLFKDEVRRVGTSMNIDPEVLKRHPFPGPGLAVRILGDITKEKTRILQDVDHIFIQNLKSYDLYDKVWQAGAVLLPVQSVGVMGDERTYESVVALRAVNSSDGMTADWSKLPHDFLANTSNDIINQVRGVNRVVYDISSKPPATIEWE